MSDGVAYTSGKPKHVGASRRAPQPRQYGVMMPGPSGLAPLGLSNLGRLAQ